MYVLSVRGVLFVENRFVESRPPNRAQERKGAGGGSVSESRQRLFFVEDKGCDTGGTSFRWHWRAS